MMNKTGVLLRVLSTSRKEIRNKYEIIIMKSSWFIGKNTPYYLKGRPQGLKIAGGATKGLNF